MESRSPARLNRSCASLLALALIWGCGEAAPDLHRVGERLPDGLGQAVENGADVVWVLRPEDYLTCQTAADAIRRAQRLHGSALEITVISVGSRPEWVRAFLVRQRIDAEVRPVPHEEFVALFGYPPAATLYLTRDGVIRHALITSPQGDGMAAVPRLLEDLVLGPKEIRGGADQLSSKEKT